MKALESRLRAALELDVAYGDRRLDVASALGQAAHPAAVLLLFGAKGSEPCLLLTKRTDTVDHHKGQMAFPGGRAEPEELGTGGLQVTALRETEEEVGIAPEDVRVLGPLPELAVVTGFRVTPFVAVLEREVDRVPLRPSPAEIAETIWIPLSTLQRPGVYRQEFFEAGPLRYPIHVYQVESYRIWGATAAMIRNLLERLERVDVAASVSASASAAAPVPTSETRS